MTDTTQIKSDLLEAVKAEIPEATEQAAKLYSRVMLGKRTLAYLFDAKDGLKVDLYAEASSLPKGVAKMFAPGRGRARKEGLILVLTGKKAEQNAAIEGMKIAAAPTTEPEADEHDIDHTLAAKAADAKAKGKPRARPKDRAKATA